MYFAPRSAFLPSHVKMAEPLPFCEVPKAGALLMRENFTVQSPSVSNSSFEVEEL